VISRRGGGAPDRLVFTKPEVTIGRVAGNDVVLAEQNISKRHARVVVKDGKFIIVDLKSTNGTYVNGRKITSPLVVTESDRIYIGDVTIGVGGGEDAPTLDGVRVPYLPVDATEKRLIGAIVEGDESSREVYADWLEERGDTQRAEFVRLQQQIARMAFDDPELELRTNRLRTLASLLPLPWRVQVARPAVEGCSLAFELQCPREWGSFAPTHNPDVRHCDTCRKDVHYCSSVVEARRHARQGHCVAIDLRAARWGGDIEPPYNHRCGGCGLDIGDRARICPSCGRANMPTGPVMMAGMILPHD